MFVAVYWWRVHPGKEDQFREAWRRGTAEITRIYGSYGSRLHRNADGRFIGYAEWPDEATWRAAFEQRMVYDDNEARAMRSEEHTSELQSLMRISYAVFCLKKKKKKSHKQIQQKHTYNNNNNTKAPDKNTRKN